jgi:CxxC motif-containing protein (DUF1111 family)
VETVALRLHATYSPHCDFALHEVGSVLRDQISQGQADGDQFRTAPLWGIGQCIFFLHDGRTDDLLQAIQAHAGNGSEENGCAPDAGPLRRPGRGLNRRPDPRKGQFR